MVGLLRAQIFLDVQVNGSDSVAYNLLARAISHEEKSSLIVLWDVLRNHECTPRQGQVGGRFEVVSSPTPQLEGLVSTYQFSAPVIHVHSQQNCSCPGSAGW